MKKRSRGKRAIVQPASLETPRADAITVGWMLSMVTTLLCEVGALVVRAALFRDGQPLSNAVSAMFAMLLFSAFVVGIASLLLIPVVYKVRRDPPPRSITIAVVIIGAAPLVTMALRAIGP